MEPTAKEILAWRLELLIMIEQTGTESCPQLVRMMKKKVHFFFTPFDSMRDLHHYQSQQSLWYYSPDFLDLIRLAL
jgi:hypothetical protein